MQFHWPTRGILLENEELRTSGEHQNRCPRVPSTWECVCGSMVDKLGLHFFPAKSAQVETHKAQSTELMLFGVRSQRAQIQAQKEPAGLAVAIQGSWMVLRPWKDLMEHRWSLGSEGVVLTLLPGMSRFRIPFLLSLASLYWTFSLLGTLIWPVCHSLSHCYILHPRSVTSAQLVLILCLSYRCVGISWHEFIEFLSASWCTQNLPHIESHFPFHIFIFHFIFLFVTCICCLNERKKLKIKFGIKICTFLQPAFWRGHASERSASLKIVKYSEIARNHIFVPLACEVTGVWCAEAVDWSLTI